MSLSSKNERGLYKYCKEKSTVWGMASSMLTHCEKKSLEQYQSHTSQNSILHVALEGPSASFIQNVLKKAPRTVWLKNNAGKLPLHVACENGVATSILELLIKVAEAEQGTNEGDILNTVDKEYMTPLHHRLLAEPSITMADVELLSGCGSFGKPGAIALADKKGNLPLHTLCRGKKTKIEVLHFMLQLYPQAIEEKNDDDKIPAGLEPSHEIGKELDLKYWEDLSNNPIRELEGSWKYVTTIPKNTSFSVAFSATTSNEKVAQNATENVRSSSISLNVGTGKLLPAAISGGLNYTQSRKETQTDIEKLTDSKGMVTTRTYEPDKKRERHIFQYCVKVKYRYSGQHDSYLETKVTDLIEVEVSEETTDEHITPSPPRAVLAKTYFKNNLRIKHEQPMYDINVIQIAAQVGGRHWDQALAKFQKRNPSNPNNRGFKLNFKSGGPFDLMTDKQATDLVEHVPHGVAKLKIWHATFGSNFMKALIKKVRLIEKDVDNRKLKELVIHYAQVGPDVGPDDEKWWVEEGERLAEVLRTNTTIELLRVYNIDLIGQDNVKVWTDALKANTTLTRLMLNDRVGEAVEKEIREATMSRKPALKLLHEPDFEGKGEAYNIKRSK